MTTRELKRADARLHHAEVIIKQTITYLRKNGHIKEATELMWAYSHLNKIDWLD
jgi:hypothetical protein